jgi:hypothetical protein
MAREMLPGLSSDPMPLKVQSYRVTTPASDPSIFLYVPCNGQTVFACASSPPPQTQENFFPIEASSNFAKEEKEERRNYLKVNLVVV